MIKCDCKENIIQMEGKGADLYEEFVVIVSSMIIDDILEPDELLKLTKIGIKNGLSQKIIDEIDSMDNIGDALNLLGAFMASRK